VVGHLREVLGRLHHAHAGILARVVARDLHRSIRAVVVDEDVLEVGQALTEHAPDALLEIRLFVEERRDDADEGLRMRHGTVSVGYMVNETSWTPTCERPIFDPWP
jgi:hypothetical protein